MFSNEKSPCLPAEAFNCIILSVNIVISPINDVVELLHDHLVENVDHNDCGIHLASGLGRSVEINVERLVIAVAEEGNDIGE